MCGNAVGDGEVCAGVGGGNVGGGGNVHPGEMWLLH